MPVLIFLFALLAFVSPVHAQAPAAEQPATQSQAADELIRILEDDQARAALIERLQTAAPSAEAPTAPQTPSFNFVNQLSAFTDSVAQGFVQMQQAGATLIREFSTGGVGNTDLTALAWLAFNIFAVFAAVYGVFWLARLVVNRMEASIAKRVEGRGWLWRAVGAVVAAAVDLASILISAIIGYVTANALLGIQGNVQVTMELLITAFMLVELYKLGTRFFLAPRHPALRLLPIADEPAAYWSFWLNRLIALMGYTVLFVTPALTLHVSSGIGRLVEVLAMAAALVIAIIIVLQNKDGLRSVINALAAKRQNSGVVQALVPLAIYWHVIAVIYLIALYIVWLTNPDEALPFMMAATAQSLVAILIGIGAFMFIARFAAGSFNLPEDLRERLPLLETRLKSFVPHVLAIVRWLIVAIVILAIAQAWTIFDAVGWAASDVGAQIVGSLIAAALIVVACIVLYVAVSSWVEYRLNPGGGRSPTAREKTLLNLFKNAFTVALVVFGLMFALAQIGVNIAPLLAGAGVVGLAIGFGAQKLVQDIITGIFIQFENIMNEGDVVEAAGKSGVVEKLTIRSVTIRDMTGTVHLIPFSSVDQVSNMVRGFSFYIAEIEVAYDSDIEAVKQALRDAFAMVMASDHKDVVLDDLDLQGLIAITPASMTLRARIKTLAGKQWGAGRYFSEMVMRLFIERGIETPTQKVSYVQRGPNGKHVKDLPPPGAEEDTSS